MDRREELRKLVQKTNATAVYPLIDNMLYLEGELERLKQLPMIRVDENNPERQKATAAAKLYKEFLQQYTNCVKVVMHAAGDDGSEEESPLRTWAKAHNVNV